MILHDFLRFYLISIWRCAIIGRPHGFLLARHGAIFCNFLVAELLARFVGPVCWPGSLAKFVGPVRWPGSLARFVGTVRSHGSQLSGLVRLLVLLFVVVCCCCCCWLKFVLMLSSLLHLCGFSELQSMLFLFIGVPSPRPPLWSFLLLLRIGIWDCSKLRVFFVFQQNTQMGSITAQFVTK